MPNRFFDGIITSLVTPFRQDERIDYSAWQAIIDHQIAAGVNGLLVAGGPGEFFSLEREERIVALRFCRQFTAGRVLLYGNVGCVTTRETIKLAQQANAEGVDVLVVIAPYYLRLSEEELAEHYIEVCHAVTAPVMAYNLPGRTGVDLTPALVARIAARCENFAGITDSSGRLEDVPELLRSAGERPFAVFMGCDHLLLRALDLGCNGAVSACANVAPRLFADLYAAFGAGDKQEAARLQELVILLRQSFARPGSPAVIKTAMEMSGISAGPCRRPVGALPPETRAELAIVLDKLREENYLPAAIRANRA